MTEVDFAAGAVIFRPGDTADTAYLIHSGQVEILAGRRRVAVLGPKDVFGEMSLVEARPRSLTALAVTPVSAVGLTADEFERLFATDPGRLGRYLRGLYARLRDTPAWLGMTPAPDSGLARPDIIDTRRPPPVILFPLTPRAATVVPGDGLPIRLFPFRIGRPGDDEEGPVVPNDLWLPEAKPYNVSRSHAAIELTPPGAVVIRDRGSRLGCVVNDEPVGGPYGARSVAPLNQGQNVLIVGPAASPYQFRVTVGLAAAR